MRKSISFGVSREKMDLTGPLGNVRKYLQKLPGPGNYEAKDPNDWRGPALRSRLPDNSDSMRKNVLLRLDRTLGRAPTNTITFEIAAIT